MSPSVPTAAPGLRPADPKAERATANIITMREARTRRFGEVGRMAPRAGSRQDWDPETGGRAARPAIFRAEVERAACMTIGSDSHQSASHPGAGTVGRGGIPSLDGIRAVSILIVFLSHAGLDHIVPGGFGLTLFFFLSGYLITTLLVREAERHGSISLGAFYARRALRLLPPLFVTLAVAVLAFSFGLIGGEIRPGAIASQLFFYSNYYNLYGPAHQSLDGTGVLWSLAVEEHFYLMFPLLFILLLRRRIDLRFVFGLLLLVLAWRWVRVGWLGSDEWTVYFSTDTRIDSILYGCLLALLEWRGVRLPTGRAAWVILAAALATIGASLLADGPLFRSTFRYTLQGIALMPIFYYAVHMPDALPFRPLNWRAVRQIGVYSYVIYLGHDIFITALERRAVEWPVLIAGAAALSIAYAAIVHVLVEKPFQRLRAGVTGHGPPLAPKLGEARGLGHAALGVATQESG